MSSFHAIRTEPQGSIKSRTPLCTHLFNQMHSIMRTTTISSNPTGQKILRCFGWRSHQRENATHLITVAYITWNIPSITSVIFLVEGGRKTRTIFERNTQHSICFIPHKLYVYNVEDKTHTNTLMEIGLFHGVKWKICSDDKQVRKEWGHSKWVCERERKIELFIVRFRFERKIDWGMAAMNVCDWAYITTDNLPDLVSLSKRSARLRQNDRNDTNISEPNALCSQLSGYIGMKRMVRFIYVEQYTMSTAVSSIFFIAIDFWTKSIESMLCHPPPTHTFSCRRNVLCLWHSINSTSFIVYVTQLCVATSNCLFFDCHTVAHSFLYTSYLLVWVQLLFSYHH